MKPIKVLFFAANPTGTTPLKLDEEIRAITQKVRASAQRDLMNIKSVWAVRPDDLLQSLNEYKPQIVHFSSHGSSKGEIILLDSNGKPKSVSAAALGALFKTLKDNVRVVILNTCHSRAQAEAIIEHVDCTVGMNAVIGDQAAIIFAASFYRAIGFGRSIQEAFEQGKVALMLEGIPEDTIPELLYKSGVDPRELFLLDSQHYQHFNWYNETPATEDVNWIKEGLEWLRHGFYSQYGSDRVHRYQVTEFSQWEQEASTLDDLSLYDKGRLLIDNREYPKATAYWAALWKREPTNPEYESYLRLCLSKVEREIRIENAINALIGIAESTWHLGDYKGVIEYMNKVLALSPNHPAALRLIERAQEAILERARKHK